MASPESGSQTAITHHFKMVGSLGVLIALVGCGLNDTVLLETTSRSAVGGAGSTNSDPNTVGPPSVRPSPFCRLLWGRKWDGTPDELLSNNPPRPTYPNNLGMMTIWIGYEPDDSVNPAIVNMLEAIGPGGDPNLQGLVPVFYAYFIPFKANNSDKLGGCDPTSTGANICTRGAQWIRDHRDYLRRVYDDYAKRIAEVWGTTRPAVWLLEPRFNDYIRESQQNRLTPEELSAVASDLIGTVRARMPNALISHFASPEVRDLAAYFSALDLSRVDLVNTTGAASSEFFGDTTRQNNPDATYRHLHEATGLPILVDTGFDASAVANHGWLNVEAAVINQRIADGVVAVQIEPPTDTMQDRIATLTAQLSPISCER